MPIPELIKRVFYRSFQSKEKIALEYLKLQGENFENSPTYDGSFFFCRIHSDMEFYSFETSWER
ncbi:hypothetical protein LEP1GSC133_2004 [Leptospira borgpetersenii serovar Pomona str. 200901868]|uniref:Uncharacterized protein n=1 Tax=Leptospira borgpetersenii serovar Pomona str. 200901868 TaxID=1192866 RepID=M6W401_LEPBO|nr:hypothetical protein LEP1GSC133_2004 [Leptospira borgpetersenii serovar Pomona str. 200901868]